MQTDKTSMRAQTKNEVWIPATSEKEETKPCYLKNWVIWLEPNVEFTCII